jgi:prepilin-type N-terminal cleavage/methylation domain-containing protein
VRTADCELPTVTRQRSASGFTLIEVTIAIGLLVVIALGSAQLFVLALRHNVVARQQLVMTLAAARKAEELSAAAAAGTLAPSPPDALDRDASGFADVTIDAGVVCVRRWLVAPVPGYGGRAMAITVRVSVAGVGDVQIVTIGEAAP